MATAPSLGPFSEGESAEEKQFYAGVRELLAELPETDDITIVTLKGHLVIEQLVVQIIECSVLNPEPLKELNRLQFASRVALAEAFTPVVEGGRSIWPLVRKVGKIRNDIAHQLRPRQLEQDIQAFLGLYVRFFGARVRPPISDAARGDVTADNYLIPRNVRVGTMAAKYRNALAGTAQGVAGTLAVIRDNARKGLRADAAGQKPRAGGAE